MKQTYIIPSLKLIDMSMETLIAESIKVNKDAGAVENAGWVKEDRASQSGYNVWDDNWSE